MQDYNALDELVPKTQELHRAIFDKGYEQGQKDVTINSILGKIRAEIEERAKVNQNLNIDRARALCWCLDVIDKYKAESEEIGKWIDYAIKPAAQYGRHLYQCPKCGKNASYFVSGTELWWDRIKPNFCPNCGAKMEVSECK